MKPALFVILVHLILCFNNAASLEKQTLLQNQSSNYAQSFFDKHSNNSESISPASYSSFLNILNHLLLNDKHSHSHEEHGHDVHQHKYEFNKTCLKLEFQKLRNLSNLEIKKTEVNSLSNVLVVGLDNCIQILVKEEFKLSWEFVIEKKENWMFAFLSSFIITVIGLLCYLVVPSLNVLCFNYFFQFLVALAVGSLSGDALLHLIPHAFSEHDHSGQHHDNSHNEGVYKGLGAITGIYVFFLIEKIMQMRRARKEKRHRHDELNVGNHSHDDREIQPEYKEKMPDQEGSLTIDNKLDTTAAIIGSAKKIDNLTEEPACLVIHANKDLKYISKYLPNNKCMENIDHHDHENEIEHLHQHSHKFNNLEQTSSTIIQKSMLHSENNSESDNKSLNKINELKNSTQKRSSSLLIPVTDHSHSHKYKSSREKAHHDHHRKHEKEISDIKLIAWMVLMGDGLHNFSDGLAIGASFASNLPTGFGTAIAVLCHELPHEIGDFAVLRRAGVSLKRALVFNVVSGVLCMLGTLVGLLIGGFPALSNWVFLFIAGTFLYISLVDMIPELSENKEDDSILNFLTQSFGILIGVGIMLAIALYEQNIIKLFN